MQKAPLHLGLHSGPPRLYKTAEQRQAQWNRGPKVLGPSIAMRLAQRSKATPAASNAASSPKPNLPPEATRASLEKDRKRIETADLSKVKVW